MMLLTAFRSRRRHLLVSGFVAGVLLITAACGAAEPKAPVHLVKDYVALGDSYTAVSGAGPFTDSSCLRSEQNYPNLLAQKLSAAAFEDVSCGGAKSSSLTETEYPPTGGSNPPQLDAVTKDTALVTLGIGLNNNGLSFSLLLACMPDNGKQPAACQPYLDQPDSTFRALIANMGTLVAGNLAAIRAAAPKARIVLVGYPRVVADDSPCPSQLPLSTPALDRLRSIGRDVNRTLKRVAAKAGADFIDMYDASVGHDVCADDPWVNGQRVVSGVALPYHPYAAYHVAVADKIYALLKK